MSNPPLGIAVGMPVASLRVVRRDVRAQLLPRHDMVHLHQECLAVQRPSVLLKRISMLSCFIASVFDLAQFMGT